MRALAYILGLIFLLAFMFFWGMGYGEAQPQRITVACSGDQTTPHDWAALLGAK